MRRIALRVVLAFVVVLGLFVGHAALAAGDGAAWWRSAVFYEVFVRSFQDSDGDGKGDLSGLIDRLDYLNDGDPSTAHDLGITALWLMPIMESPSYHGYDVVDYYRIEEDYGSNADFQRLMEEAHARGIRVIVDLVLNHTSSRHPWFLSSMAPESARRDWYVWTETPPLGLGPWGQTVWHRLGSASYFGLFWSGMPDLNYRTPAVTAQMLDIVRYWLVDMGADGFRLDAVRHLIETESQFSNTAATHFWLKGLFAAAKGWKPDALLVGEIWDDPQAIVPYLDSELDVAFEFSLAEAILQSAMSGNSRSLRSAIDRVLATYPAGRFATFLSNHDQERVMTRLRADADKAKLAAFILFTLPGTPFVYYGEEIGMTGAKPDERIRTPMQWEFARGCGFTSAIAWQPFAMDAALRSVAGETADSNSLLSHYRSLIALRAAEPALSVGATETLAASHPGLLAYTRSHAGTTLLVVHNLTSQPVSWSDGAFNEMPLPLGRYMGRPLAGTPGDIVLTVDDAGAVSTSLVTVAPYGTILFRVAPEERSGP
jgi:glycosidase